MAAVDRSLASKEPRLIDIRRDRLPLIYLLDDGVVGCSGRYELLWSGTGSPAWPNSCGLCQLLINVTRGAMCKKKARAPFAIGMFRGNDSCAARQPDLIDNVSIEWR